MTGCSILQGNCLDVLPTLESNSVDSIVTDPPYGISFMGKKWDYDVPSVDVWRECLRVLKPGGHLLSFAGTRTQHRMAVNIEDAGFEIRDMIFWTYASGFPKSLNIFKQLIKRCTCGNMEAYEKETIQSKSNTEYNLRLMPKADLQKEISDRQTEWEVLQSELSEQSLSPEGLQFSGEIRERQSCMEGWDNVETNSRELSRDDLCEMSEGILTDGKERRLCNAAPVSDGSTPEKDFNKNGSSTPPRPQSEKQSDREPCSFCKQYGTQVMGAFGFGSALKPACEPITVARKPISEKNLADNYLKWGVGGINIDGCRVGYTDDKDKKEGQSARKSLTKGNDYTVHKSMSGMDRSERSNITGRFPANLIHDGSDEVVGLFPQTKSGSGIKKKATGTANGIFNINKIDGEYLNGDSGSASRFFYCAKASKQDRDEGCGELPLSDCGMMEDDNYPIKTGSGNLRETKRRNNHPTVKPTSLMRYLCKLVTPPGGIILDPFMGSGSTGKAATLEGFQFIGIEIESDYTEIAGRRIGAVQPLFAGASL